MSIHLAYAAGILLVGWFGFAFRRSSLGGLVSGLVVFEGLLAVAALAVFIGGKKSMEAGPVLLWTIFFGGVIFLLSCAAIGLRQYFVRRSVKWNESEENRH